MFPDRVKNPSHRTAVLPFVKMVWPDFPQLYPTPGSGALWLGKINSSSVKQQTDQHSEGRQAQDLIFKVRQHGLVERSLYLESRDMGLNPLLNFSRTHFLYL